MIWNSFLLLCHSIQSSSVNILSQVFNVLKFQDFKVLFNSMIQSLILDFIARHSVMTLATSVNDKPYCASMFYAFLENKEMFVFISQANTKHIQGALTNNEVAGAIALETTEINKVEGIQFTGKFQELKDDLLEEAKKEFKKKFPFVQSFEAPLWGIALQFIKMTHNEKLGFGKKLIWNAHPLSDSPILPLSDSE